MQAAHCCRACSKVGLRFLFPLSRQVWGGAAWKTPALIRLDYQVHIRLSGYPYSPHILVSKMLCCVPRPPTMLTDIIAQMPQPTRVAAQPRSHVASTSDGIESTALTAFPRLYAFVLGLSLVYLAYRASPDVPRPQTLHTWCDSSTWG